MNATDNSILNLIKHKFLGGVFDGGYTFNGGEEWYKESTLEFKFKMTFCLLPLYFIWGYLFYSFIKTRKARVPDNLNPCLTEKIIGYTWYAYLLVQVYTKVHTNTMIFLFNPCHIITLVWAICLTTKHSIVTQVLFLYGHANVFNPYLGMLFAENDELEHSIEIVSYWLQHATAAFIAPAVLIIWERYGYRSYFNIWNILWGYQLFWLYMRFFLTPLAAITWANLNHTLWGIDNDPFRRHFQLKEYYYFWSEFYLWLNSLLGVTFTYIIKSYLY